MKREELIEYLRAYPGVTSVSENQSDDAPEWSTLELLFDDGTKLNLNPDVLSTSDTDDIDIGATEKILQALDAERRSAQDGQASVPVLPLVRSLAFAIQYREMSSGAFTWLTDFIGYGIALEDAELLNPNANNNPAGYDALQLQSQAFDNLHKTMTEDYFSLVEFGLGPNVVAMPAPEGNEAAWFADIPVMEYLIDYLSEQSGTPWVVIPATRNQLFFVNTAATAEEWGALLDALEPTIEYHNGIYPIPHSIIDGQWVEQPIDTETEWGRRLHTLQLQARTISYNAQAEVLSATENNIASYKVLSITTVDGAEHDMSFALVPEAWITTSVPRTDLLFFESGNSGTMVPWQGVVDRLPHLIEQQPDVHPPRYTVKRPTLQEMELLQLLGL